MAKLQLAIAEQQARYENLSRKVEAAHQGSTSNQYELNPADATLLQLKRERALKEASANAPTLEKMLIPAATSQEQHIQQQFNMDLIKVLQAKMGAPKDESSHISKAWKEVILPPVTCKKLLEVHDFPMNTFLQRAAVNAAKTLLLTYDLHWKEESDSALMPTIIPLESVYHDMAVLQTLTIKNSIAAHAFPKAEKPQIKERRQVLAAVMGSDLTAQELKEAYSDQTNWRGKGSGAGGSQDRSQSKGRYQGKGKGRGKGYQGKGRGGWSDNRNNDSRKEKKKTP